MDWKEVLNYVRPELLIMIVILWCLGLFLKKAPWFKDEWKIPFILLAIGVVFTVLWVAVVIGEGFSAAVIISSIGQGIIIAAIAVFGNELIKQSTNKRINDNISKL